MVVKDKSSTKITVDLGDQSLYRDVRIAAIELDRSVRDIFIEALRQWLERQDALEDQYDLDEARRILTDPTEERIPFERVAEEFQERVAPG